MQAGEGVTKSDPPKPCEEDSHTWKEDPNRPGENADDGIATQDAAASDLAGKPSRAGEMRGAQFESKAIKDNKEKLPVEKCGKHYICSVCGKEQEVDIVGGGRVAEVKSQKAKGVKNKSKQCKRLKSIQAQCVDKSKKPLAKIDGSLDDADQSKAIYERRGFDVEVIG